MSLGYERLSKLDETFLAFETPNTCMHVALTGVFEPGTFVTPDGGIDVERIREHIGSRLHLVPRYRQRLLHTPVVSDAIWIDDANFDLGYHVRHTSLPRPGTEEQLRVRCAEILERPLNRDRPLWESWVIEGLAGGRFALLTKVHHCMVDGVGGVGLLAALFDTEPRDAVGTRSGWAPRPVPGNAQLLRDEVSRRTRRVLGLGRTARSALDDPRASGRAIGGKMAALWSLMSSGLRRPAAVPFNGSVGGHRRLAWLSMRLDEVKALRRILGGTVNDVVLTVVAGGVRRYLQRRPDVTAVPVLKVAVPVNVRDGRAGNDLGNHVSIMMLSLPTDVPQPGVRLRLVQDDTLRLKTTGQRAGVELLTRAAEWATGNALRVAVKLLSAANLYNLIVTNIPGPPVPLYLLGARLVETYPFLPLFENQGLGLAIFSYDGRLYWGLTGDWDLMSDLDDLAGDLLAAFDELLRLAGVQSGRAQPVPVTAPRAAPPRSTPAPRPPDCARA